MFNSRSASSAAVKRLTIEYKQLSNDPNTLFPAVGPISEDNYLEWEALVPGPDDTPFEGGVFSARLSFREWKGYVNALDSGEGEMKAGAQERKIPGWECCFCVGCKQVNFDRAQVSLSASFVCFYLF